MAGRHADHEVNDMRHRRIVGITIMLMLAVTLVGANLMVKPPANPPVTRYADTSTYLASKDGRADVGRATAALMTSGMSVVMTGDGDTLHATVTASGPDGADPERTLAGLDGVFQPVADRIAQGTGAASRVVVTLSGADGRTATRTFTGRVA